MKISDIDKNLAVESATGLSPIVWLDAKEAPFRVHGLAVKEKGGPFLRMPHAAAASVSEGVEWLNNHTAGGRIRFRTDSPWIAMRAVMPDNATMPHITMLGQSGFDLYQNDGPDYRYNGSPVFTRTRISSRRRTTPIPSRSCITARPSRRAGAPPDPATRIRR